MAKGRGKIYWGELEEEAIHEYVDTENIAIRHRLFEDILHAAFKKLIENIFFTYHFNAILGDLKEIEHELLIHLYEKIDKFDPKKGTKSFSFFGTVAKHWLIQKSNLAKRRVSLDDDEQMSSIQNVSLDNYSKTSKNAEDVEFIELLRVNFKQFRDSKVHLNNDDRAVLEIIESILKNYTDVNIYNKKQIYVFLREGTGLPSKKITRSLKKIKMLYRTLRDDYYE